MLKKRAPGRKKGIQQRFKQPLPPFLPGRLTGALGRPASSLQAPSMTAGRITGVFGASIAALKISP